MLELWTHRSKSDLPLDEMSGFLAKLYACHPKMAMKPICRNGSMWIY